MILTEVEIEVGKEYSIIIPPIERYCEATDNRGVLVGKSAWHPGKKGDKIKVKRLDFVCIRYANGVKLDVRAEDLRERG